MTPSTTVARGPCRGQIVSVLEIRTTCVRRTRLIIALAHNNEPGEIHRSQDGGSVGVSDDVDLVRGVGVFVEQRDSRYQPTHIYISHLDCLELYYTV